MKIVRDFPYAVTVEEYIPIPLADGTHLAARLWRPEGAEQQTVPAILEYIPYRRRDSTRLRDDAMHHYFAGHGYACLRVTCAGPVTPRGCWRTNTCSRNWTTAWRFCAGWVNSPGATAMWA